MGLKFSVVRGTKDILPVDSGIWQGLEGCAREIFSLYGYREVRTPILEPQELFCRGLGQDSEVVNKQMFSLSRPGEDAVVLRPEGTAGILRAYLENNLDKTEGFSRLCYSGPMFRAERPQKGRLRQFHHIGAEAIGSLRAEVDAEIISLAAAILDKAGVKDYRIEINSLGCAADKRRLADTIRGQLKDYIGGFCADCQRRYGRNVFRILDCKNINCRKVLSARVSLELNNYLCLDCRRHFDLLRASLDDIGVRYEENRFLVRGLDYYTRSVFEIKHSALGAQDAIGAGGRYDNLSEQLGGPSCGAAGFALGVERLILALGPRPLLKEGQAEAGFIRGVYIVPLGDMARREAFKIAAGLRKDNILVVMDYQGRSLKAQLRRANNSRLRWAVILGDDELKDNRVLLKDMQGGEQRKVEIGNIKGSIFNINYLS